MTRKPAAKETVAKDGGRTSAPWIDTPIPASHEALPEATHCDVCVIGGGIAGLSAAYELSAAGHSVIVLDDGPIGGGESARTSAHLASALDDRFSSLEKLHGERGAQMAAQSHAAAIDRIEQIARLERIECEFRRVDGYLFAGEGGDPAELDRELAAARRAGLTVEKVGSPLPRFDVGPTLRFAHQAELHPLAYLAGLASAILARGGRIHPGVRVVDVEDGRPVRVTTADDRVVTAAAAIVATNVPGIDRVAIHTKQAAYRSYVVALAAPPGALPRALYWDTVDPYHYVRVADRPDGRTIILVGGEDHKTGQADDAEARYARLEAWIRERVPEVGAVVHRWSGQILEPSDGLAFIGRNPGDRAVFVVTGDSGNGLTHGALAGLLLRALVVGDDHEWATLYDPSRTTLAALPHLIGENANTAAQYGDWFTGGEVGSADEIAPGEGGVVRRGLKKLAIYRAPTGELHERSATCPHLGGVVRWNSSEKTWDCPCHGSRFDAFGRCVNGPAMTDLEVVRDEEAPRVERPPVRAVAP